MSDNVDSEALLRKSCGCGHKIESRRPKHISHGIWVRCGECSEITYFRLGWDT